MGNELALTNVVNISVSQANLGVGAYNTSNLAIFTCNQVADGDGYFTDGYRIYLEAQSVGTDFGTDSVEYAMALGIFSQQPNILAGGGYLVFIQYRPALQTITFSDVPASGSFKLAFDEVPSSSLSYNSNTVAVNQACRSGVWGVAAGEVESGSVISGTLVLRIALFYGAAPLVQVIDSTLKNAGGDPITATVVTTRAGETYAGAITRTASLVQYFGTMALNGQYNQELLQADILAAAAVLQSLNKIGLFVSSTEADVDPGGTLDLLRTGGFSKSRGLYYGSEATSGSPQVVYLVPNTGTDANTLYTVTIDSVVYSFTTSGENGGDPALAVAGLIAAVNADTACPVTASGDTAGGSGSLRLVLTGKEDGVPFTWTASANMLQSVALVNMILPTFATGIGKVVTVNGVEFTSVNHSEKSTITCVANTASSLNGTYFDIYEGAAPGTAVRFWFSTLGVGAAPSAPVGGRLVNVDLSNASLTPTQVANALFLVAQNEVDPDYSLVQSFQTTGNNSGADVVLGAVFPGNMTNVSAGTSGFSVAVTTAGTALGAAEFNNSCLKDGSEGAWIAGYTLAQQINASADPLLDDVTAFMSEDDDYSYLHLLGAVGGLGLSTSDATEIAVSVPFTPVGGVVVEPFLLNTDAMVMMASYAGRAFSTQFEGSNTTSTMHLKTLAGVQPDPSMTQTLLTKCLAAGADTYVSLQGDPAVFTSGENGGFFDQVYNLEWFVGALQVAGYNYLAQSATKVPQTESGMDGLKGAYRAVCQQAVTNAYSAPGSWNSSTTFGNQANFLYNIGQIGYYIYSGPIASQSQATRVARTAPLVQIALKEAGAIQKSNVIVYVNP